ncbi:hypothetical protein [Flavobacterium sp.]|uniref:hypothetical protein n=1 Tax=Flavobacterium sp. TaxID=239 RepID=UPI0025BB3B33|nr:hypothetical protein [Flavobacterium sp.]
MKKVFFTAIAMIAFSSASMANTIADEEVVVNNIEKKEIVVEKEVVVKKDCVALALFVLDVMETLNGSQTYNDIQTSNIIQTAIYKCEKSN